MSANGLHPTTHTNPAIFTGRSVMLMLSGMVKMLVQLTVILLYARMLPVDLYGQYQSVWLYTNVISAVSLFGLPALILSSGSENIFTFFHTHRTRTTIISLLLFILPVALLWALEPGFTFLQKGLLTLLILAQNIAAIREVLVLKHGSHKKVLLANIVFSVLFLLAHLAMTGNRYSLDTLLMLLIGVFMIKSAMLKPQHFTAPSLPAIPVEIMGKQWLYLGLFDTINTLYKWLDKWIILSFLTIQQFALYYNGAYEIPVFGILVSAVGHIMLVEWGRTHKSAEHIRQTMHHATRLLAAWVLPAFVFLIWHHENFFLLLFGNTYADAVPVFFIALFILPLRITNFTAVLQFYQRSDRIVLGAIIDLITAIVLMFILYPLLHVRGIILAVVISTWIQAGYYLWASARITGIPLYRLLPFSYIAMVTTASFAITAGLYYATLSSSTYGQLGAGFAGILLTGWLFGKKHLREAVAFLRNTKQPPSESRKNN